MDEKHLEWSRELNWPRFNRYVVADKGFRTGFNRYPDVIIGAYVVVGRHAYCVRWASPKVRPVQAEPTEENP